MFYWVKTNRLLKWLFSNQIWSLPNTENTIYLTFDDGPTPEVTQWVLELLQRENTKATFFCIGENISKHPEIFKQIINEGHSLGNHTFNHLNGWKTSTAIYLENIQKCNKTIYKQSVNSSQQSKIFRPPYGKITPKQSRTLRKLGYKIIMWDILSADFDTSISAEKCYENATQKVTNGSIIVFHDSKKAFENMQYALPKAIQYYKSKGFSFGTL
jgi:peptidoglycan-N-acetylglucosamine deacetylase